MRERDCPNGQPRASCQSTVRLRLVLERQLQTGAVSDDFAALDLHVQLGDFRDTQIAKRPAGRLYCALRRILPRRLAAANDIDDAVYAFTTGALVLFVLFVPFAMVAP